jgi:hypothetical protein
MDIFDEEELALFPQRWDRLPAVAHGIGLKINKGIITGTSRSHFKHKVGTGYKRHRSKDKCNQSWPADDVTLVPLPLGIKNIKV